MVCILFLSQSFKNEPINKQTQSRQNTTLTSKYLVKQYCNEKLQQKNERLDSKQLQLQIHENWLYKE